MARQRVLRKYDSAQVIEGGGDGADDDEETLRRRMVDREYLQWKKQYYKEKMHIAYDNHPEMDALKSAYIEGLQWVMHYYYDGVQSWGW